MVREDAQMTMAEYEAVRRVAFSRRTTRTLGQSVLGVAFVLGILSAVLQPTLPFAFCGLIFAVVGSAVYLGSFFDPRIPDE